MFEFKASKPESKKENPQKKLDSLKRLALLTGIVATTTGTIDISKSAQANEVTQAKTEFKYDRNHPVIPTDEPALAPTPIKKPFLYDRNHPVIPDDEKPDSGKPSMAPTPIIRNK
jgi:hypothetical protein